MARDICWTRDVHVRLGCIPNGKGYNIYLVLARARARIDG